MVIAAWFYLNREVQLTTLKVAAGPYRSDSYELMEQIADVVERQSDLIRLKILPTKDSSENISKLNAQAADLATIRSDTPVIANVRMVADLFPDFFQVITRSDREIYLLTDLEGKKVAIPPFGTDEFRSFWAVADHYDLSITSIKWVAMPFAKAAGELLTGEIDALFTVRSLRDRLVLNLFEDAILKDIPLKLLEIDQAEAIQVKRPFLQAGKIPKGAYGGSPIVPNRDTVSSSVIRTLVARENIAPELVRELTRILFENRLDLVIRFALASAIHKPDIETGLSIPLHPGAEQYYNRDQPSFLQENAEPIALLITIAAMIFSGLLALRSRLTGGQKNRMDSYNYMLLEIADQARASNSHDELRRLKDELFGILETVVRALDTDEVTEEGFQSFSLLWESVREVINDQDGELV
jgi:TRAP transporter TAXI family solute receptor